MPRSSGWKDYIPASGEGRALLEVKGKVGRGAKGGFRRRSSIGYLRSARSTLSRKAMEAVPLGPGPMNPGVITQTDRTQAYNGHLGTAIQYKWLFAITPELMQYGGEDEPPIWRSPEQADGGKWSDRLRVVGWKGDLFFTPQQPLATAALTTPLPEACHGLMGIGMAKFKATGVTANTFEVQYPWTAFSEATAYFSGAGNNIGLGPHSEATMDDVDTLFNRDLRTRRGRDVMFHRTLRWEIPIVGWAMPAETAIVKNNTYRLPLPRRMLADVGQGEALGVWFWCKDMGSNAENSGSPVGRFDYPDLRVQYRELDG